MHSSLVAHKTERITYYNKKIKQIKRNWMLYVMFIPVAANFIIFHYWPMYGLNIAFRRFNPVLGYDLSPWVGFENFVRFFESAYVWQLIRNTLAITLSSLALSPLPIILALFLNEIKHIKFKKTVQTISYLPHFISAVIVVGILNLLFASDGIVNMLLEQIFGSNFNFLTNKNAFLPLYLGMGVWQATGFESIIFIAAITAIDPELYEAAEIDGAGRWKKMFHITLPGILPTLIVIYIMRMGNIMNVGWTTIYLMQNALNEETSEVISTFVYKRGLVQSDYSFGTAVGLLNNIVGFALVYVANKLARSTTETSLF